MTDETQLVLRPINGRLMLFSTSDAHGYPLPNQITLDLNQSHDEIYVTVKFLVDGDAVRFEEGYGQ